MRAHTLLYYRDMEMEREELMKWAFPRLRKFCSDRGVFLTQVDLRWGITEDQSQAGDTINICLREGTRSNNLPSPRKRR
jgi:hypothetical protein